MSEGSGCGSGSSGKLSLKKVFRLLSSSNVLTISGCMVSAGTCKEMRFFLPPEQRVISRSKTSASRLQLLEYRDIGGGVCWRRVRTRENVLLKASGECIEPSGIQVIGCSVSSLLHDQGV